MSGRASRRVFGVLSVALVVACAFMAAGSASAAPGPGHFTGTLPDGATWIADVPANWNGTLLLYSHGYGPLLAADAPNPPTPQSPNVQQALLARGYALAGSSYDPNGSWWALGSAVRDQFQTLAIVKRTVLPGAPSHVYAFGTSMGGLISALEDQNSNGRLDGALTTCGIVAGANNLNQYQLDGEYAMSQLLAPGQNIQLTNFSTTAPGAGPDSVASANALLALGQTAQKTAQGQARLALAMAFLNVSPWGGSSIPNIYDFPGQEQGQYEDYFLPPGGGLTGIQFIVMGRNQIEKAAGGESSGTVGVDFARLLHESSYYPEVRALYTEAGLSLTADLLDLQRNANLHPDRRAFQSLSETSVPTGRLQVPELDLHTISDQLVPVQQEAYYHALVERAGDAGLLRQAFVQAVGHCNFTTADLIAGLHALEQRVATGSWGDVATAGQLNQAANALNLDGGDFLPFWPTRLTGAIPPGPPAYGDHGGRTPFRHDRAAGRRRPRRHADGRRSRR
ncbi:MAG TPA: hypothetical protein VFN87_08855 [Solirubrobacteraceae bacterium]|nr:hypothetical protein [Solirubrobacteraceae bacterium]